MTNPRRLPAATGLPVTRSGVACVNRGVQALKDYGPGELAAARRTMVP